MKGKLHLGLMLVACSTTAFAQSTIRPPNQFYTNGESLNAWAVNSEQRLRSTIWFARHSLDSLAYKQMLAIVDDAQPDKVFYIDPDTKHIVGRLDLDTQRFSALPADARQERWQDIDESSFSTPADLPRVAELFEPPPAGQRANSQPLLLPPPTPEYPQLDGSVWDTSYMAANRSQVKAILEFQGDRGTYRLNERNTVGRLSDVVYQVTHDGPVIHGRWTLGRSNGHFRFQVPADNLNVFWGEWGFDTGNIVGAWYGYRRP